jgi:thiol:disulfide interchange protein DsbD
LESVLANNPTRKRASRIQPGNKTVIMRPLPIILFLLVAVRAVVRAEIPADWSTNYDATISAAAIAQQPVLVYFTASWCGPCKLMSRITLTDPAVFELISNVEHVAVDIEAHPDLATKHGVNAVPTFILLSSTNDEVERVTGFQGPGKFLSWLTNSISEAKEALIRQTVTKKELTEVDELLAASATNATPKALEILCNLCDERDKTDVQAAVNRLNAIASHDPAALLEGLNAPRLAARIQVANLLRLKIGERFDVDPWSDAASRREKVLTWREQLVKHQE